MRAGDLQVTLPTRVRRGPDGEAAPSPSTPRQLLVRGHWLLRQSFHSWMTAAQTATTMDGQVACGAMMLPGDYAGFRRAVTICVGRSACPNSRPVQRD